MKNYSVSNKDLLIFFVVTFGLTILLGFAMSLVYPTNSVGAFPLVQMYYPTIGVMLVLLLNKNSRNNVPKKFFFTFIFFVTISIAYMLIKLFVFNQDPEADLGFLLLIFSCCLVTAYSSDNKEKIEEFGLSFGKDLKESIRYIGLFILLYFLCLLTSSLFEGDFKGFITPFITTEKWGRILLLPLYFLISFPVFLGEEYGWRYFLQPALQERLGKRKGILFLGLIWGIWHLPINIFYYSPLASFHSVLNQLIICTAYSIFFGFVYMKTKNIWIISIIHFLNNNLGAVLYGGTGKNVVFSWQAIFFNLVLFSIIYGPFLLTSVYKNTPNIEKSKRCSDY